MYKIVESFTTPIVWVLILMIFGLILEFKQPRKRLLYCGKILIIVAGLVLYLFSIPAISNKLLYSLESQYHQPNIEHTSSLDLVVVLGAGYHPSGGLRKSAEPNGLVYTRIFGGVKAFKNSGAKTLVLCGGGDNDSSDETDANVMKTLAMELGVQEEKIITENKSNNTMENATELKRLLFTKRKRHIGLVTSALHMPRSDRVFKQVFTEDTIIPIPVGYRYSPSKNCFNSMIPSSGSFHKSTEAIHEWIGMLWYKIRYSI